MSSPVGEFKKSWIAVPAGIVVAVVAVIITTAGDDRGSEQTLPSASQSESSAPIPSDDQDSPSPEPAAVADIFTPVPLTYENLTDRGRCDVPGWSGSDWASEISSIAGVPYTSGMSCRLIYSKASGYLDYLVPHGAKRLTAVAGQRDDASNTTLVVRFQVLDATTGNELATHDLGYGQSAAIDVPLAGVLRVTLRIDVISYGTPARDKSGSAGWAEPTFR